MLKKISVLLSLLFLFCFALYADARVILQGQSGGGAAPSYVLKDSQTTSNAVLSLGIDSTPDRWCGKTTFTATASYTIRKLEVLILRLNSGAQTVTVSVCDSNGANCVAADQTIDISAVGTSEEYVPLTFATGKALTATTQYMILQSSDTIHSSNIWRWSYDNDEAGQSISHNDTSGCGGSWTETDGSGQGCFKAYSYE
jgi:hypothetical protein